MASLWPLALLAPFLPGLPHPSNSGLNWREEVVVGALLCVSLGAAWLRARGGAPETDAPRRHLTSRAESLLVVSLAAFVVLSAASLLWAVNSFAALHHTLSWVSYALFFLVLRRAATHPRLLASSLKAFTAVVFIIAAANCLGHWTTQNSMIRQVGLGEPVAVSVPLLAALALGLRRRRQALYCGATASVAWLSTLQISERAPFLAVCAGLLLLGVISSVSSRFRPRSVRRVALLAAPFALAAALQVVPSPFEQTAHRPVFERLQGTSVSEVNTRARLLFWGTALEMFLSRPLTGVGAGGYDAAFAEARASFSARHADSPLVAVNESFLTKRAHNEYLQILAELGGLGLLLFCAFCAALVWLAAAALRRARGPLVPGAVATLAAFALSSGASSLSFRWMGSGLVFFFAAALVTRLASAPPAAGERRTRFAAGLPDALLRRAPAAGLAAALAATAFMCTHGANVILQATAQGAADHQRADRLFRAALSLNPLDPAGHFNYGQWLVARKREPEAVGHLRYAVERGFNTSTCYQYLAGAESNAGELAAAERTLALAVRVYPRSVFARVRHASALRRLGRSEEAGLEMSAALLINSGPALGWEQLIENDIDAAVAANKREPNRITRPGELEPVDAVMAVLEENERRFPGAVNSGWRAQARAVIIR